MAERERKRPFGKRLSKEIVEKAAEGHLLALVPDDITGDLAKLVYSKPKPEASPVDLTLDNRGRIRCRGLPIDQIDRGDSMWCRLFNALGSLPVDVDDQTAKVRAESIKQFGRKSEQRTFLRSAPTLRERRRLADIRYWREWTPGDEEEP